MNTVSEFLTVSGIESAAITATDDARAKRDALLVRARKGTAVVSAASAENAGILLRDLKAFTRSIEDARKEVKEPVLEIGKRIDGLARELTDDLNNEAARISRLVGAWQAEQNKIAEEARRKAWEEEQRIKDEANRKIEEARQHSRTEASFEKKAEKIEAAAMKEIVDTRVSAAAVMPAKPAGLSTREEICFEVLDLVALYEAAPYLVSLTPNNSAIKAALKGLTGEQKLPGVRHWKEQKAIVR